MSCYWIIGGLKFDLIITKPGRDQGSIGLRQWPIDCFSMIIHKLMLSVLFFELMVETLNLNLMNQPIKIQ